MIGLPRLAGGPIGLPITGGLPLPRGIEPLIPGGLGPPLGAGGLGPPLGGGGPTPSRGLIIIPDGGGGGRRGTK